MPPTAFPSAYVNRAVSLKFFGHESVFQLSHGLFSSFDIDAGTRLLLKSIAARVDLSTLGSIYDIGCGVGVIGVCLARAAPQARVVLQDRDALAAAFARENCRINGAEGTEVDCGLAFWHMQGKKYDLVASNIPAKAGRPVLEHFFRTMPHALSRTGTASVVIVSPLENLAREAIPASGCLLLHEEKTRQHVVFHFSRSDSAEGGTHDPQNLAPYVRTRKTFTQRSVAYSLETAYNIPDFDTIGHAIDLAQDVLAGMTIHGEILFWNPGQGHLPVFLQARDRRGISAVHLAGRDSLELEISAMNLARAGGSAASFTSVATEAGLMEALGRESLDFFLAVPHPVPKAPWEKELAQAASTLLRKGGILLVSGTSTDVFRVMQQARRFRVLESRKRFGFRAVLLKAL